MLGKINAMEASLLQIAQKCQSLNKTIVSYPEVEQLINKSKKQDLQELSLPVYSRLQSEYALTKMQLISSQGAVMASVNKLTGEEKDVGYRRLILKSLQDKESLEALESAEAGINLVSTCPLFTGDKFIGVSELDMSIEQVLESKLVKKEKGQYSIFKLDGIHTNLIWEEKASHMVLNTDDIKKIHQGEAFFRPGSDKQIMLLVVPLKDIDDIPIGYIQGEISRQAFLEARTNNLLFLIIMTLLIITGSCLIIGQPGAEFAHSQHEAVNLMGNGKISHLSINVKPVNLDNHEDEQP